MFNVINHVKICSRFSISNNNIKDRDKLDNLWFFDILHKKLPVFHVNKNRYFPYAYVQYIFFTNDFFFVHRRSLKKPLYYLIWKILYKLIFILYIFFLINYSSLSLIHHIESKEKSSKPKNILSPKGVTIVRADFHPILKKVEYSWKGGGGVI